MYGHPLFKFLAVTSYSDSYFLGFVFFNFYFVLSLCVFFCKIPQTFVRFRVLTKRADEISEFQSASKTYPKDELLFERNSIITLIGYGFYSIINIA